MSAKPKILIIDDDLIYQQVIRKILDTQYEIIFSENLSDAIEFLDSNGIPDLLIADLNLPGTNCMELIKSLINKLEEEKAKILVISGMDDEILNAKLLKLGVSAILTKPIERTLLMEKIECLINSTSNLKYIN